MDEWYRLDGLNGLLIGQKNCKKKIRNLVHPDGKYFLSIGQGEELRLLHYYILGSYVYFKFSSSLELSSGQGHPVPSNCNVLTNLSDMPLRSDTPDPSVALQGEQGIVPHHHYSGLPV